MVVVGMVLVWMPTPTEVPAEKGIPWATQPLEDAQSLDLSAPDRSPKSEPDEFEAVLREAERLAQDARPATEWCPLCGRATSPDEAYCGAKQCQWTERLEASHPNWSRDTCVLIGRHRIRMGMTRGQVRESWGSPKRINRSVGSWGVHEQWVYSGHYLYSRDGVLRSWQD